MFDSQCDISAFQSASSGGAWVQAEIPRDSHRWVLLPGGDSALLTLTRPQAGDLHFWSVTLAMQAAASPPELGLQPE